MFVTKSCHDLPAVEVVDLQDRFVYSLLKSVSFPVGCRIDLGKSFTLDKLIIEGCLINCCIRNKFERLACLHLLPG